MQTCFSSDDPDPPGFLHHRSIRRRPTRQWHHLGLYPHCCHVESQLSLSLGMTVSLSLHLQGNVRVKLEQGLITWARASEFA